MIEIFISKDDTQYIWDRSNEHIVQLNSFDLNVLKLKIGLMNDFEIMNQESGNGTPMGIPLPLTKEKEKEIRDKIVAILVKGPFIDFEEHAIARIVEDSLLDKSDPRKRGWNSQLEATNCILSTKRVLGVRLNVDHRHPENTEKIKHLHQQCAILIEGKKNEDGIGRLVMVFLNEEQITVVTVL